MDTEEALLKEWEQTFNVLMHESRTVWELISIYIVLQGGLISATILLFTADVALASFQYSILSLAGAGSSLLWVFMQYRSKMRRKTWLFFGLRIEKELEKRGILLDLFETEYQVSEEGFALEKFGDEIRKRYQLWHERVGAVRLAHLIMGILAIAWFAFLLGNLLYSLS